MQDGFKTTHTKGLECHTEQWNCHLQPIFSVCTITADMLCNMKHVPLMFQF